jgi:Flp pilus assembly protein TadG
MMKTLSEKGQAIVLVAFAAIGLIAFAALAIDGGRIFSDKRHAQNAADSAALAVALGLARGGGNLTQEELNTVGWESAAINGYDDKAANIDVIITKERSPRADCKPAFHGWDAQVQIVSTIDTTLARVIGRNQVTNVVTAYARYCDPVIDLDSGTLLKDPVISLLK